MVLFPVMNGGHLVPIHIVIGTVSKLGRKEPIHKRVVHIRCITVIDGDKRGAITNDINGLSGHDCHAKFHQSAALLIVILTVENAHIRGRNIFQTFLPQNRLLCIRELHSLGIIPLCSTREVDPTGVYVEPMIISHI